MDEIGGSVTFAELEAVVDVDGVSDCLLPDRAAAAPSWIIPGAMCGCVFAMLIILG